MDVVFDDHGHFHRIESTPHVRRTLDLRARTKYEIMIQALCPPAWFSREDGPVVHDDVLVLSVPQAGQQDHTTILDTPS